MARPKGTSKSGVIRFLNENQLKAFSEALSEHGSLRDQVMMNLTLHLGLRAQELVNIRIKDIEPESYQITIQGLKGGRKRAYAAINKKLWRKLKRYIKEQDPKDQLFPVSVQTAKNIFKKYARLAGLNSDFSIHSLRHTCGILRAKSGDSPIAIMLWLRHRSISSTMVYVEQVRFERDAERMNNLMDPYF
jgi:integrase